MRRPWVATPLHRHVRAWWEGVGEQRLRVDADPEILVWTDGARPYSENSTIRVWDGEQFRYIFWLYGEESDQYAASETHAQIGWPENAATRDYMLHDVFRWTPRGFGFDDGALDVIALLQVFDQTPQRDIFTLTTAVNAEQQVLLTVHQSYGPPGGGQISQYVFDPASLRLVQCFSASASQYGARQNRWEILKWRQVTARLAVPTEAYAYLPASFPIPGRPELDRPHRQHWVLERFVYFDPADADAIFDLTDVDLGSGDVVGGPPVAAPSKGPAIDYQPTPPATDQPVVIPAEIQKFLDPTPPGANR